MFQKTIIKKYLKTQDSQTLQNKWIDFQNHFHNPNIQENIRNSKEEQYQEGFLRDLFVDIFGYTLNPTVGFNLTTELRNIKDAKKADGGILIEENVVGVIELKGTNTTDLGKVEQQAFNYKNNQTGCVYVITSNFEKLRFYIDDSVTFVEFNLFDLKLDDFNLLYLLLSYENIKNNIPKKIKDESLSQEDTITKKLYKDYSLFKRELFQNLVELNPDSDQLELFKKTQKLLDRLLFLFFGEDRGLLPPNSVRQILEQWNKLNELDECVPLYNRYKKYFGYLNTGYKGKHHDVFAYNGGLFKADEILDHVKIDDQLLYKHSLKLSEYDFASEVDVNILGHIFENSLNEIDEIKSQLEGKEVDKSKTKRKKDGVFYTPKYITKYIVENTVGKLCEEKKTDFGIIEEDYFTDKKRQQKTKENLLKKLDDYREWLLHITIVDPACGSGAFLNEALNFLIEEHQYIDELESKLTGSSISFSYHSESILENNLFGVDLNEESVEIAKLSLWLRTAEPNRKLNSLNDNIKCGNSLIDDPEIAGNKAFKWEDEFPQVFAKGGFDVVIGNPPYGVNITDGKDFFSTYYKSTEGPFELYKFFIEKSLTLLKCNGFLGFITPDTWINLSYFKKLRNLIFNNYSLYKCSESLYNIFSDAVVDTSIFIIHNRIPSNYAFIRIGKNLMDEFVAVITNKGDDFILNFKPTSSIIEKLNNIKNTLGSVTEIWRGMSAYGAKNADRPYNSLTQDTEFHRRLLNGGDIGKYIVKWNNEYIKFGKWLHRPRPQYIYDNPKILIQRIRNPKMKQRIVSVLDEDQYVSSDGLSNILIKDPNNISLKPILGILNSKLINYWFSYHFYDVNIKPEQLRVIPLAENIDCLEVIVNKILDINKDLQEISGKFQRNLQREFSLETLPKKLQSWDQLSYADFLKELAKQKVTLSLSQKSEWEDYFETEKKKVLEIKSQIDATDKEIDQMVYELYGLTEEEIKIVENS
ncbi:Eco57I restriction-modification methylase domain-containing protein [Kaistella pullorum]|uniref:site-specific DNA-methyltransferase (adenine-specific) n=1 Tax=Kaistella pullorum TaxID=2763074 RepID=A0ABR8WNP1_9FLAO|nr:TaqI-like C-terminal specificity domain-containing protein [Kaistella pullorum]MBD8018706.1 Eco57I restriction-modification methylase domain-containing protein [Kaistella pullorum]